MDWKRKLTSRKLWVAAAGFAAGLIVMFGGTQETADKVTGSILSGAAVVGYILGEGLSDAAGAASGASAASETNGTNGASAANGIPGEKPEDKA